MIYDITGHVVLNISKGTVPAGTHSMRWDGCDVAGHRVASGIYFYRIHAVMESGKNVLSNVRKVILMK